MRSSLISVPALVDTAFGARQLVPTKTLLTAAMRHLPVRGAA